ncbi:cobyric acid synthase [Geopsychrobacter electrodiphilus]|uniref:cobyric acid synthase n=1 Tax=Geopsychrobacter electrodiphilus TaxID=225196 RepID=UPI00035DF1A7|nr:cobyric acid synthase [Geopsychrobacter electrodiphilus]
MQKKLFVIGLGPGDAQHMTPAALTAIESSTVVTGYQVYLELIADLIGTKETFATGMRQETERCREALRRAAQGAVVALVCSGDAGIYGMAGLVLELQQLEGPAVVEVEIIPGVSAVQGAAARLGAPLMHDFAVISLSDLLTDWSLIRRRLDAAGRADFVIALYNPKSRGRTTQIGEARAILMRHRAPETPVGIVRNACRAGESVCLTTLADMLEAEIDMFSVVIIGNSSTRVDNQGRMVTPRGYEKKREVSGVKSEVEISIPLTLHSSPLTDKKCNALFIGGTGSDVGKSVISAGLCRILKRRGYLVAPFKAQNMANNSAVTPGGGEIGRAQALQAAACGLQPHVDMNPVLLKPNSETGSQVIVQGRPVGNMGVREYHQYKDQVWTKVVDSYRRLSGQVELVVLEGAGSIAEINLRAHDFTNLKAAEMAGAAGILVADIERGGVFASILGTVELLTPAERALLRGIIINRFRGDASLLDSGIAAIEDRTGLPVIGVVPYLKLDLPAEDSLGLERRSTGGGTVLVGVVRLQRISNHTDFDALAREPDVDLIYVEHPAQLQNLDLLILPGTKSTLADLEFLKTSGLFGAIQTFAAQGGRLIGICGGLQLLGRRILDPERVESSQAVGEGLGLLDLDTTLCRDKQTHQVRAQLQPAAAAAGFSGLAELSGYEIHAGETEYGSACRPLLQLTERSKQRVVLYDGAVSADGRVWGSYLHGIFDNDELRRAVLAPLRHGAADRTLPAYDLEGELDRLADHLEAHLDLPQILSWLIPPKTSGAEK